MSSECDPVDAHYGVGLTTPFGPTVIELRVPESMSQQVGPSDMVRVIEVEVEVVEQRSKHPNVCADLP